MLAGIRESLKVRGIGVVALFLPLAGCGTTEQRADALSAELLAADRAFALATDAGGAEAWASHFAVDGSMLRDGVGEVTGREAIRNLAEQIFTDSVGLTWEPLRAEAARSGDIGYTFGTWSGIIGDSVFARGVYVNVWRRDAAGDWKVVFDVGARTPDAAQ